MLKFCIGSVWKHYYPDPFYVGRAMCDLCKKKGLKTSSSCAKSISAMVDHLRGSYHTMKLDLKGESTSKQGGLFLFWSYF